MTKKLDLNKLKKSGRIASSDVISDIDALMEYYMTKNYRIEIIKDEGGEGYVAHYPELKGCITCASSIEKAVANLKDAKREWLTAALEDGYPIPEPGSEFLISYKNYTGNIEFSEEEQIFHGRLIGVNDIVTYRGENVSSIAEDFVNTVDKYIDLNDLKWIPTVGGRHSWYGPNGLSIDEVTNRFQIAVNQAIKEKQQSGLPVARYDDETKQAYHEYPDGRREYIIDGQGGKNE